MRRSIFAAASVLMLLVFTAAASAQKDRFVGTFVAENPNTGGMTRIVISDDDTVNIWGKCTPRDCDWGTETLVAYAQHVGAELTSSATAMSAIYVKSWAVKVVIIKPLKDGKISVEVFTRFTDRSKRTAYNSKHIMVPENPMP